MEKKLKLIIPWSNSPGVRKMLLCMKLTFVISLVAVLQTWAAVSYSQTTTLSINLKNATVQAVLQQVEDQSEFYFLYSRSVINVDRIVDVQLKEAKITEVLNALFNESDVAYKVDGRQIVLSKKSESSAFDMQQQKSVTGKVTDSGGGPLPGVSVVVKGTTTGTITDFDGNYSLGNVPGNAALQFSFVGMKPQEVKVEGKTNINITLVEEAIGIEEVVAVGYGTVRKKDLTGAVSNVNMKDNSTKISISPVQALRGSIAGVNVTDNGKLGSDGSIQIRGRSSISASNNPLLILDGIPYTGALSDINSNDIESIDVLKDASSAAIYGSRAANGVIIVTTKRGKSGKPIISYNTSYGFSKFGHTPEYSNAEQYIQKVLDGRVANGLSISTSPQDISTYLRPKEVNNYLAGITTDPYKEISQNAPIMNHELSFSGSTEKVNYYVSGSYADQKGVIVNDKFSRYSFRSNVESSITDWMKIGINTSYSNRDYSGNEASLSMASYMSPYANWYRDETKENIYLLPMTEGFAYNPLLNVFYTDNLDVRQNLFVNVFSNIKLPYGFSYKANYSNTLNWSKTFNYNKMYNSDEGLKRLGDGSRNIGEGKNWIFDNILKWDRVFLKDHTINLTLLYSREHAESTSSNMASNNIWSDALGYNGLQMGQNPTINTYAGEDNTISTMARLNYRFKDKYLLTLTARRDGFSTFGAGKKFGTFPSIAMGWNISEEQFLKKYNWIDMLKIRYSYGNSGNQAIGRYATLSKMSTTYYVYGDVGTPVAGLYNSAVANPDLGWETTWSTNIGLDYSFLKGRIAGSFEYYNTNTSNLLLQRTIPTINGASSVWQNIGATHNRGFEFTLNTQNVKNKDFSWLTTFNFSTNKNEITHLVGDANGDGIEDDIIASGWFIGQPINANYDFSWDGIYQVGETMPSWAKPGSPRIIDYNGDGKIDAKDKHIVSDDEPDFRLSLSNTFNYKGLSLSFLFNSQFGAYRSSPQFGLGTDLYNRANTLNIPYWTPENQSNEWPAISFANPWGQKFYYSRSFVRLQDVSLSYDLPQSLIKKAKIESLKIYLSGKNLLTFTDWPLWDPEIGDVNRYDYGPMYKTFVIGLNVTF
jgi:TonB-linked SusC/RagA family outer membrane protein